ncbi:MAG: hypothetical protein HY897_12155 [Deltaproteobacteria bacterium]|nr:hypothetical protein [Deltaproteobacteria bacterium]
MIRWTKFAIYAAFTVAGIGLVYSKISADLRAGGATWAERVSIGAWGLAGLYLVAYAFVLASEAAMGRRHRLVFDVAAFVVFCAALVGRMLGA